MFNSKGFPRASAKGFATVSEALAFCDIWTMHENPARINNLVDELHGLRDELAATASRMGAYSKGPLIKTRDAMLPQPEYTVTITPLAYEVSTPTPRNLNTIVADHRVEVRFVGCLTLVWAPISS